MTHALSMTEDHVYTCECGADTCGQPLQSVTTILNGAVPKDLSYWGMMIGSEGAWKLGEMGYNLSKLGPAGVLRELKSHKLTVNDQLSAGGLRGTAVHDALEAYAKAGRIPSVANFPVEQQGYVRALAKFIVMYRPVFEDTEVRVLSVKHGFAGTFDFRAKIHAELVAKKRPRARTVRMYLEPHATKTLRILGDAKTSKWVYGSSHFAQLEAYEGAAVEMGHGPTDVRAVLHLCADGWMELVPATAKLTDGTIGLATFDHFLALKASAEAIKSMDASYAKPVRK